MRIQDIKETPNPTNIAPEGLIDKVLSNYRKAKMIHNRSHVMKWCDCPEWQPGIDSIVGSQGLAHAHGMPYKRAIFTYCPWCGAKLEDV